MQTPEIPDGRPGYCLHERHPNAAVEARARAIYMARYAHEGGWWELNETPEHWWTLAIREMADGSVSTKNLPIDAEPF